MFPSWQLLIEVSSSTYFGLTAIKAAFRLMFYKAPCQTTQSSPILSRLNTTKILGHKAFPSKRAAVFFYLKYILFVTGNNYY